jgi:hypothetical protein
MAREEVAEDSDDELFAKLRGNGRGRPNLFRPDQEDILFAERASQRPREVDRALQAPTTALSDFKKDKARLFQEMEDLDNVYADRRAVMEKRLMDEITKTSMRTAGRSWRNG